MISPRAHIGAVHLTVHELDRSVRFYRDHLGFLVHATDAHRARLGAGGPDLLVLDASAAAPQVRGTTGLYHFAILVPTRADLSQSLRRLVDTETSLQGAADHGVSEALYLADPDGNGIEIYRDRPKPEWPFSGGQLRMTTEPLDLDDLVHADGHRTKTFPAGTVIGHVHLHVADLDTAYTFYVDVLGFSLMQRYGPGALFVSAGGYHHHVGLNTWAGIGAPPPPTGAIGLRHFEIRLPDAGAFDDVLARLHASGAKVEIEGTSAMVRDPSSNAILLTSS